MRSRAPFHLVLVALAVLAALSHVCALPVHAEPLHEPVAPHATPTEPHGDDASCEAASPAPSYTVVALAPAAVAVAEAAQPLAGSPALVVHQVSSRSSPLFLLLLTLRI